MNFFKNLKISAKVLLSCIVFLIIIISIAFFGYRSQQNQVSSYEKIYSHRFRSVIALQIISRNIYQMQTNIYRQLVLAQIGRWEGIEPIRDESKLLRAEYMKHWDEYTSNSAINAEEKSLTDKWMNIRTSLAGVTDRFGKEIDAREVRKAELTIAEWEKGYDTLKKAMQAILDYQDKAAKELRNEQYAQAGRDFEINMFMLVISIIVAVLITFVLARSVSGPVNKGLDFARKIAVGDFTERIDLNQKDELGILADELNKTADNLEHLIGGIVTSAKSLIRSVQEIASGNENLSQRTTEQASSLEEIASTIEQTSAAINRNADNSINADRLAKEVTLEAEKGGETVNDAVSAINEISDSSVKIEQITGVINEISFQTNLLALNAAVEAARAGETGRGFAVVAGEVRNLAVRSGGAAKEISELIKDSINKVSRGSELSAKSGEALRSIVERIRIVGNHVGEIAASSEEQRTGINQINTAIVELDSVTQHNAGLVEETASAGEEMSSHAQELLSMVEKFIIRTDNSGL
ncbi:MAG: MCP four helix bundle domain-containing protein [Spirochaetes bacterium]|nr:MCP four helix bundle domain-containing protein [Spirochaetota bacterium]